MRHGDITNLDGTIRLPDGRQVPVVVTVDLRDLEQSSAQRIPDSLLLRAVEVFGNTNKAMSWLNSPNPLFGGSTPHEAATTESGKKQVLDTLFDLEQGFPA